MNLPKAYDPSQYEADIYNIWIDKGVFTADPSTKKPKFSISMPPPNETGTLSLGHALFLTLQDIMARHARASGKDVLWLPGTDHAALAVNSLIEKQLAQEGTDKHTVGREEFVRRTKDFVGNSRETMLGQMRAMGASADWTRLRYTLDDALNRCVNETFAKMYHDGLIYRGARIVNWDPNLQTTISDDEVEHVDEVTTFYTFKYGPFEIGTARPETKFGDKYVVMHPDDERYAKYKHGDTFETEWINGPITATIIKDEAIDPEFGTGVMTITPWHSHVDFEIAERHGLEKEQIIDENGKLLAIAGEFEGMAIHEARAGIVEKLRSKGLVVNEDANYAHSVAVNERGKGIIEPQIKLQWWVDVNRPIVEWKGHKRSLKEILQSVVNDGDINIIPNRFNKIYFHWIDNLRDWCISRQIWWGHQVPAWYRKDTNGEEQIYVGVLPPQDGENWVQDEDTLDTWFSSALWTWSTLIDPDLAENYDLTLDQLLEQSPDFQAYHPTSVMETGWDILFFWVARMILSTTYVTGQIPFKDVYLHGMVRAEDGKKMSKSRPESIIDPLEVIPQYGTDALRMALIMGVSPGNDQNWGQGKIEANRNFCNKIWNMARYAEGIISEVDDASDPTPISSADHWAVARLNEEIDTISRYIDEYRFSEAYDRLYHLVWDDIADWYIEASKAEQNPHLLAWIIETILKIAHPFAPFVTEAIWQQLSKETVLASQLWPESMHFDNAKAAEFEAVKTVVGEIRFVKTTLKLSKGTLLHHGSEVISNNSDLVTRLAKLETVQTTEKGSGIQLTQTTEKAWVDVAPGVIASFKSSLNERLVDLEKQAKGLRNRLGNEQYVAKAPQKLVEESKTQLESIVNEISNVKEQIQTFSSL
jgi:valyl-tRNA synthetase